MACPQHNSLTNKEKYANGPKQIQHLNRNRRKACLSINSVLKHKSFRKLSQILVPLKEIKERRLKMPMYCKSNYKQLDHPRLA